MKSLESSKVVSSSEFEVDGSGEAAENAGKMVLKSDGHVTKDGSVDRRGRPAVRELTGGWVSGILLLLNQGFVMLAFFGVGVNLVLFLTRVMQQSNAAAANNVSKWTGTVYIFSLVGAFLSDSYWGRYKTCAIFQAIFVVGLLLLSLCSYLFLIKPSGCGNETLMCHPHGSWENGMFYLSIYLIALGNGGYQPTIATFGADQFDEEDPKEAHSKLSFFSYFYFALNLGSLFSNTILAYFEDSGRWSLGFWTSTGSAILALLLFLAGTYRYRHFKPSGNPLPRVLQVFTATARKWNVDVPKSGDKLYELAGNESAIAGSRKILHSDDFRFLDKAATVTPSDLMLETGKMDPWRLCTVTQVEEVKCVVKMLPIWLCTIIYSVVFTQMASLFVEQGAAMNTKIAGFHIPAASMSAFDILSVLFFIFVYRKAFTPWAARFTGNPRGLTELQRMGTGLVIGMLAMVVAGVVELARLSKVDLSLGQSSSLSIMWQIPQYSLIGASEVFMYVGQLEFFNGQAPDALKSFGSALCMASISFGNYISSWLVSIVMWITTMKNSPGWIPGNLNLGHMDRFYFLLAGLSVIDFVVYLLCARWYNHMSFESHISGEEDQESGPIGLPQSV